MVQVEEVERERRRVSEFPNFAFGGRVGRLFVVAGVWSPERKERIR